MRYLAIELEGEFSVARNNQRGSKNNNPEGRNQYSNGWMGSARERPLTAAAAVGGAVAAGVILWSKRSQISEQISNLSDQIGEWADDLRSQRTTDDRVLQSEPEAFIAKPAKRSAKKSQTQIAEEALTLKETGEAAPTGL